jgi:hypothetical protein
MLYGYGDHRSPEQLDCHMGPPESPTSVAMSPESRISL